MDPVSHYRKGGSVNPQFLFQHLGVIVIVIGVMTFAVAIFFPWEKHVECPPYTPMGDVSFGPMCPFLPDLLFLGLWLWEIFLFILASIMTIRRTRSVTKEHSRRLPAFGGLLLLLLVTSVTRFNIFHAPGFTVTYVNVFIAIAILVIGWIAFVAKPNYLAVFLLICGAIIGPILEIVPFTTSQFLGFWLEISGLSLMMNGILADAYILATE
jgi:hypothetical protein